MIRNRDSLARDQHHKARALGPQGIAIVESAAHTASDLLPYVVPEVSPVSPVQDDHTASTPKPKHYTVHQRHLARERVLARTVRELDPTDIRDGAGVLITAHKLSVPKPVPSTVKLTQAEIDRRK